MGWQRWQYQWDVPAGVETLPGAILTALGPRLAQYGFDLQAHSSSAIIYTRRYTPWLNQVLELRADSLLEAVALDMDKSKDSVAVALVPHASSTLITVQANTGLRVRKTLQAFFADEFPALVAPSAAALAKGQALCMRCEQTTAGAPLCDGCVQSLRALAGANARSAALEALLPLAQRLNDGDLSVVRELYTDDYVCEFRPQGIRLDLPAVMEAAAKTAASVNVLELEYSPSVDDGRHAWIVSRLEAEQAAGRLSVIALERHQLDGARVRHSLMWHGAAQHELPLVVPALEP